MIKLLILNKKCSPVSFLLQELLQNTSGRVSPSLDDLEERKRLLLEALQSGPETPDSIRQLEIEKEKETDTEVSQQSEKSDLESDKLVVTPQRSHSLDKSMGHVKSTSYGTPVINVASPYLTLPSGDKFAKDICDVINFENLPDSTGKYAKLSTLLKRVKNEVDKIQES